MRRISIISLLVAIGGATAMADVPVYESHGLTLELGGDVVSSYIWRGQDCGGFSIQPSVALSYAGFTFGVWASAELFDSDSDSDAANMTEFDLSLSYGIGGLTVGLTDYHFCDGSYLAHWRFNQQSSHQLELNLGYDFGPVAVAWNTLLAGPDRLGGDRLYSSYAEVSAPFAIGGVDCSAAVGAVAWKDNFTAPGNRGFNVVNCAFGAKKEIKGLPLTGQVVYNPQSEATYFVVGLSF